MQFATPNRRITHSRSLFISLFALVAMVTLSLSSYAAPSGQISSSDSNAAVSGHSVSKPAYLKEQPLIRLQYASFDPQKGEPSVPADLRLDDSDGASHFYLVQFRGPIEEAWKSHVRALGGVMYDYIPDFAFIVKLDGKMKQQVRQLREVAWIGAYQPAYKLSPELAQTSGAATLTVLTFGQSDTSAVQAALGGKVEKQSSGLNGSIIRAASSNAAAQAATLARMDTVSWIEVYHAPHLFNDKARAANGVNSAFTDLGLYGAGQTVAVADTGLDTGSTTTLNSDFAGRLHSVYALGRTGNWSDTDGHGTHVAGSVLGNGSHSGSVPASHNYVSSEAGAAPEAQLVFQSIMDSAGNLGGLPADLNTLFLQAYNDGARIHSDSWGSDSAGAYDASSQQVDQFIWNHKDMVIVIAAGNAGVDNNNDGVIDTGSIGSPATAKNDFSVGATENNRPTDGQACQAAATGLINCHWGDFTWGGSVKYNAEPVKSDYISNNAGGMAAFSSRGPDDDNRIEPSISNPGTNILSVHSQAPGANTGWGAYNQWYMFEGGTSQATPGVAGAAALVRQFFTDRKGISPSGALIRATMLNSATDLNPGQYGSGTGREMTARPNNVEGWGRVNLTSALEPTAPSTFQYVDNSTGVATNADATYTYNVTSGSVPLHITLVWSDYAASTSSSVQLVNDLDLSVTGPTGTVYWGNSVTNGDKRNTTETVDVAAPATGNYTVKVHGFNVAQGGSQPFALAVLGGIGVSGPTNTPTNTSTPGPTNTPTNTPTPGGCTGGAYQRSSSTGASIVAGSTDVGNHGDDSMTSISLPFAYTFYGQSFSTANVDSNGNLQFTSNSSQYSNAALATANLNNAIIPHWDDLRTDGTGSGIFTSVSGSAPNRIFNIEWRAALYSGGGSVNFEVRLYEGQQKLDLVYGTVTSSGGSATVGIQKDTGSLFDQFSFNTASLSSGLQITYQIACGPTNTPTSTPTRTNTPPPGPTNTPTSTPTRTPTSTPTNTPPPGGCSEVMLNGGFESGNTSWTESSSGGYEIVDTTRPHAGTKSAYMAGYNNANDQIWQTVTIPAGSTTATLSYYRYITTQETSHPYDYFYGKLRTSSGGALTTLETKSDSNAGTTWASATFNVQAYAGQTVQVYFQATNDSSNPTSFFVDDVSLNACH